VPGPGLATVAVVRGLPAGTRIEVNGEQPATVAAEADGKPAVFVSLDGKPLPAAEKLLEELRAP
jgi:hypothetical protein